MGSADSHKRVVGRLEAEQAGGHRLLGTDLHHLLTAVASEIASMSGTIAATTSLINAMATSPAPQQARALALAAYLPPKPVAYLAVIQQMISSGVAPDRFAEIQHFHARLGQLRKMTAAYAACGDAAVSARGLHIDVLAGAWRDVCLATIKLLSEYGDHAGGGLSRRWHPGLPKCERFLAQAASGTSPCIMADGSVEIPGIAERRGHVRHPVSWPASMLRGGEMVPIRIDNISLGGLGVTSRMLIQANERVIVEMMGRHLSGQVVWAAGRRFGVKFAVPLDDSDPAIAAARAA